MKTNPIFLLSAGVNVILIGACGYLFTERPESALVSTEIAIPQTLVPVTSVEASPVSVSESKPARLRWEQLESDDYPTYIANLRGVGMPEPTLRNIITAEVAAQYEGKRQDIAAQPAQTESAGLRKRQLLEQLQRAQETVVASLLSDQPSGGASMLVGNSFVKDRAGAAAGNGGTPATAIPALLPAVLVPPEPAIGLTKQQAAEWPKLQQDFIDGVGGPNQDANDPDYAARWIEEQRFSDELFKAKYGTRAFVLQNLEAGRQHVGN